MVDIGVKRGAAWACGTPGCGLADVLLPVHLSNQNMDEEDLSHSDREKVSPVLLEQVEEGSSCVLTVSCSSSTSIRHLLVISEARTMEVYDQVGEYCGTVRGTEDKRLQPDRADRGPFYRKQLILDHPSSACELKLLSLAGRSSVLVCRVIVGLQELQARLVPGPGIDLQQVQSLVEDMGTSLSPGAQHLMDMVQFQQRNQTGSLGGFLPLLMGRGVFSALPGGVGASAAVFRDLPPPADATAPEPVRPARSRGMSEGSSSPDLSLSDLSSNNTSSSENGGLMSHAQLEDMMSHFLKGRGPEHALSPELLPMLQSVCGQVTQLRLADADEAAEKDKTTGTWELDSAMERRLEEMERRLKEHMDRRLDALEQKLEKALLSALPVVALTYGEVSRSAAGPAPSGPSEQIQPGASTL